MNDHVAEVHHQPAVLRAPFKSSLLFVFFFGRLQHSLCERVQHAVAGAVADHKIVSERGNLLYVEKQDFFTLPVLQGVDDFMGKFESVQVSPLGGSEIQVVTTI